MMIRLGLERISKLLTGTSLPWRAVHVAGTNGKGSICFSLSHALTTANVGKIGRFTSPHLVDRWDCIAIGGLPVPAMLFHQAEAKVKARDEAESIGASEFELLTATAFEIFTEEQVRIAVVECGMGGLTDATNVLNSGQILATIISHVGLDHQTFLGDTAAAIAEQKAGIIKRGSGPCIIDCNNTDEVLNVVHQVAARLDVTVRLTSSTADDKEMRLPALKPLDIAQRANLSCAYLALDTIWPQISHASRALDIQKAWIDLTAGLKSLPGRYQPLAITSIIPSRQNHILVDGAHNPSAWQSLALHVDSRLRPANQGLVWIFALSGGRTIEPMLASLVQSEDAIIFTEFGLVDGMPWVRATPAQELADQASSTGLSNSIQVFQDLRLALEAGCSEKYSDGSEKPVVVAGSLYLVGDLLRLLENNTTAKPD